jgi:transcription antitermination factor NusA-like protein
MDKKWSKEEFYAYLLTFAALCDQIKTKKEWHFILSKIAKETFYTIHNQIVNHSEKESYEIIKAYLHENKYSQHDNDEVLNELKSVFFADDSEKEGFQFLRKLLS